MEKHMFKINYYLGLNDKDTKTQLVDVETAHALIGIVLSNNEVYGATLYDVSGLWNGESENTIMIELVMDEVFINHDWMASIGYALRMAFNQATVMMTVQELKTIKYFDYI